MMQWPYVITAEQWAAFGAMLSGFAQIGVVVIGWYAGKQWFQQKRVEGLHALVPECLQLMHDMEVATDRGRALVSYVGYQEKQFEIIAQKYIQLMGVATRCMYYDDKLAELIRLYALHVNELLRAYHEEPEIIQMSKEEVVSEQEKQRLHKLRRAAMDKLFRVEDDPWYDTFQNHKKAIIRRARFVSWGRESL
jgi:hypothetical protein